MSKMQADNSKAESETSASSAEIARRIRVARARAGFTRKQLSIASGASERYLALLEAGSGNPSVDMLHSIANALGIAMADLMPLGGEREANVAQLAQLIRRLSPERIQEIQSSLGELPGGDERKARRIALIGLRGAGKSSLGAGLAQRLGVPFFEISKEVERRCGGSIGALLELNGPSAVHRHEAEVISEISRNHPSAVVAAPGAIVANGKIFDQLLRSAWSIWLQAKPEDHMNRVIEQGDLRPMAGNRSAMNDLKSILAAREADYSRSDERLNTSAQGFDQTLDLLEISARRFAG